MEETIMRSEAMRLINSGQPFSLEYVTADRRRGTGGDLISVTNWLKVAKDPVGKTDQDAPKPRYDRLTQFSKDPQHHQHKTFNIFNPANRQPPSKVHFRLIVSLNGKRVING